MGRLKGTTKLIHDAVEHTTNLVEEADRSVSSKTMRYLELFPPVGAPARLVDGTRRLIASSVFASIRGVNRVVEALTGVAVDAVESSPRDERPLPLRSDQVGTRSWAGDAALGIVNGVVGDYLHTRGNDLDLGLRLRYGDRYLRLRERSEPLELPGATSKVAVFVHGLTCTEWSWSLKAEEYHGDPSINFGTLLRRDLEYTPIYARYNTGRHISENGELLAEELDLLLDAYPEEVEELVLIGHSMGGLVIRSACHAAGLKGHPWLSKLKKVAMIASPHEGAPLEKVGNLATSILKLIDHPGAQIPAKVINLRSAGIKDLRRGSLTNEDWEGRDPDKLFIGDGAKRDVPLLNGVAYCLMASTVTANPRNPLGALIGDVLVRLPSATGPATSRGTFNIEVRTFEGIAHLELQNHPDVYEQLRRFFDGVRPP